MFKASKYMKWLKERAKVKMMRLNPQYQRLHRKDKREMSK